MAPMVAMYGTIPMKNILLFEKGVKWGQKGKKNEDDLKNEADLKIEDDLKNWPIPQKHSPLPSP